MSAWLWQWTVNCSNNLEHLHYGLFDWYQVIAVFVPCVICKVKSMTKEVGSAPPYFKDASGTKGAANSTNPYTSIILSTADTFWASVAVTEPCFIYGQERDLNWLVLTDLPCAKHCTNSFRCVISHNPHFPNGETEAPRVFWVFFKVTFSVTEWQGEDSNPDLGLKNLQS